jgi:inorganic pyrophosphatase
LDRASIQLGDDQIREVAYLGRQATRLCCCGNAGESRAKLEFDSKLRVFTLAKPLLTGITYPYDWGFIPSTKADDDDPIDVLIIHEAATYPGLALCCKPIGVLEVMQMKKGKKERNDRVFVVPDRSPFEVSQIFDGYRSAP